MNTFILTPALFETADRIERIIDNYSSQALEDQVRKQCLKISFVATQADEEILVRGSIEGDLTFECSRCLVEFAYPVSLTICQSYPVSDPSINVEDEVRQLLLLDLPVQPICISLCKGICPSCGKNKNIEDCNCPAEPAVNRWSTLGKLLKKDK